MKTRRERLLLVLFAVLFIYAVSIRENISNALLATEGNTNASYKTYGSQIDRQCDNCKKITKHWCYAEETVNFNSDYHYPQVSCSECSNTFYEEHRIQDNYSSWSQIVDDSCKPLHRRECIDCGIYDSHENRLFSTNGSKCVFACDCGKQMATLHDLCVVDGILKCRSCGYTPENINIKLKFVCTDGCKEVNGYFKVTNSLNDGAYYEVSKTFGSGFEDIKVSADIADFIVMNRGTYAWENIGVSSHNHKIDEIRKYDYYTEEDITELDSYAFMVNRFHKGNNLLGDEKIVVKLSHGSEHNYRNGECLTCGAKHGCVGGSKLFYSVNPGESHFSLCECGQRMKGIGSREPGELPHYGKEWEKSSFEHWAKCECGVEVKAPGSKAVGRSDHNFVEVSTDTGFYKYCMECGYKNSGKEHQHIYAKGVCINCGYEHKNHVGTKGSSLNNGWHADETSHWIECICGIPMKGSTYSDFSKDKAYEPGKNMHTYEKGYCTACGKDHREAKKAGNTTYISYGCIGATNWSKEVYNGWNADAEYHWVECSVCGMEMQGIDSTVRGKIRHNYVNGACTTCTYEHEKHVGTKSGHYDGWFADETSHWVKCICGVAMQGLITSDTSKDRAYTQGTNYHTYDNGYCSTCKMDHKDHTYKKGECTICGKKHDCIGSEERGYYKSAERHWAVCVCGNLMKRVGSKEVGQEDHVMEDGKCNVCEECDHIGGTVLTLTKETHAAKCKFCNRTLAYTGSKVLNAEKHKWNGTTTCTVCKMTHEHIYENKKCTTCEVAMPKFLEGKNYVIVESNNITAGEVRVEGILVTNQATSQVWIEKGKNISFLIKGSMGFIIDEVTVDGVKQVINDKDNYTQSFNNIQKNYKLKVKFVQKNR